MRGKVGMPILQTRYLELPIQAFELTLSPDGTGERTLHTSQPHLEQTVVLRQGARLAEGQ